MLSHIWAARTTRSDRWQHSWGFLCAPCGTTTKSACSPRRAALRKRSGEILAALTQEMERGTDPKDARVQNLIRDMENTGKEMMEQVGGREKTLERIENFKRYRPLIPQAGDAKVDELKAKMKPFQ